MEQKSDLPSEADVLGYFDTLSNAGRWGDDDQVGTINLITKERTKVALSLVETAETISCALPFGRGFPNLSPDYNDIPPFLSYMIVSGEHWGEQKPGELQVAHEFWGFTPHGYNYTHIDALSHIFWDGKAYNNRLASVVTELEGATELAVDVWKDGIFSRGVLLDFRALREPNGHFGVDDVVYLEDVLEAEKRAGLEVREGDILLHRLGVEDGTVRAGHAGFHPEVLPWFHERGVAVIGGDTAHDVKDHLAFYPMLAHPIHQVAHVAMGLAMLDNVAVNKLAAACERHGRSEFYLSIAPLPAARATGSPVNPIAMF